MRYRGERLCKWFGPFTFWGNQDTKNPIAHGAPDLVIDEDGETWIQPHEHAVGIYGGEYERLSDVVAEGNDSVGNTARDSSTRRSGSDRGSSDRYPGRSSGDDNSYWDWQPGRYTAISREQWDKCINNIFPGRDDGIRQDVTNNW